MTADKNKAHTERGFSGPARATFHVATGMHISACRFTGGRVWGRMMKSPLLLLTSTGRKTGKKRTNPLLYREDGGNLVVFGSAGGSPRHPAWWLNLREDVETVVQMGRRKVWGRAEQAAGEEKDRLWTRWPGMYPGFADYQKNTTRELPVVVLRPLASASS